MAGAAVASWAVLLAMGDAMPMSAAPWLGAWTVMMGAMMLPSASPLVLLYARQSSATSSGLLSLGYLAVWAVVGLAAYERSPCGSPTPATSWSGASSSPGVSTS